MLTIRKIYLIAFVQFIITLPVYTQQDSIVLKRGFYKGYTEYLTNAPSLLHRFEAMLLARSKQDTTIAAARFKTDDSVKMPYYIWGFCDGQNVFVNPTAAFYTDTYWKLGCTGSNPYFYYSKKSTGAGGPVMSLVTDVTTSMLGPFLELLFIDNRGLPKLLSVSRLKKLLKKKPDLLKAFKRESSYDMPVLKKYILKFNQNNIAATPAE